MANEKSKHKISDYFSLPKLIDITQVSGGYSRIELAATGILLHDAARLKGIQKCLYSGYYYSCNDKDFEGYPAEAELSISALCDEHRASIFSLSALERLVTLLDTTSYKTLKMFAGKSDKLRWDMIADMGQRNAIIYIKKGIPEKYAAALLLPFIQDTRRLHFIAYFMSGSGKRLQSR